MKRDTFERLKKLGIDFDDDFENLMVKPLEKQSEKNSDTDTSTISFKGKAPDKIEINKKTSIEFLISGESRYYQNNINVEMTTTDNNINFSTSKWTNVDFGFTLKTTVTAQKEGSYVLQFKINGKDSNALNLFFYNKSSKEEPVECLCKKNTWSADDLKYIVTQLRKKDIQGERQHLDERGNRMWLDKDEKVIPSTDRGRRPTEAVKPYNYSFSLYDVKASDGKLIEDRLFYIYSDGLNIKKEESDYHNFTKQINSIFKNYEINNCLRRIHFFAQVYVETQRLSTTYETTPSSSVSGGDFYRGRGIKQITHDYNYLRYYDFKNGTTYYDLYISNRLKISLNKPQETVEAFNKRTNNQFIPVIKMQEIDELVKKISTDIFYACDSAGWYWKLNKINKDADEDNIFKVSAKVNNPNAKTSEGINDYENREKYYNFLKNILDYENCK